jgi:hypothetical protein
VLLRKLSRGSSSPGRELHTRYISLTWLLTCSRRVRQLEQRVESLIDMLATGNNTNTAKIPSLSTGDETMVLTPDSSTISSSASANYNPTLATAPAPSIDPCSLPANAMHVTPPVGGVHKGFGMPFYEAYDPITAGVVDEQHATLLLHEFNNNFVLSFPFVVVTDGLPTLRRDHPFLLHAILTVTSYASPQIQHELADELKRQVARLVEHSQKGLGVLQGLMVYVAWYHTFYHPATQQLGLLIQMCVAMVQDLDGRNLKTSLNNLSEGRNLYTADEKDLRSLAHYRALLGTYCLSVTWVFQHLLQKSMLTCAGMHKPGGSVQPYHTHALWAGAVNA